MCVWMTHWSAHTPVTIGSTVAQNPRKAASGRTDSNIDASKRSPFRLANPKLGDHDDLRVFDGLVRGDLDSNG